MKIEVLISCMHQNDSSIVKRSNIQSDVLIINQCDIEKTEEFLFLNNKGEECKCRMIYTKERGLSRSRNMALKNAMGDICLICDDDEVLEDNYSEKIISEFNKYGEDILAFRLLHPTRTFSSKSYKIGFFQTPKIGSYQICFRRSDRILSIPFCEKMGSGTNNGGGEENKFLIDCIKKGLKIRYVPLLIGSVAQTESQWFHGYTKKYWIDRGWVAKMIFGSILGYLYLWYTLFFRSYKIDKTNNWFKHFYWLHKGFLENR